jgi:mRNA export factor
MYDVQTGQSQNIAGHDAPIKCVNYLDVPNGNGGRGMLATGGWDRKLKVSSNAGSQVCKDS